MLLFFSYSGEVFDARKDFNFVCSVFKFLFILTAAAAGRKDEESDGWA